MIFYQSVFFLLLSSCNFCSSLSTIPDANSIYQHISVSDHIHLSNDGRFCVEKPVVAGTKLLEWHEDACLTPHDAFSDMDIGLRLREFIPRVGPGIEFVAIATFLGAEYIRNFKTRPNAFVPEGGDEKCFTEIIDSKWSEITQGIWADAIKMENYDIESDLEPIVDQGVTIALPILDATMRRAWSSGTKGMSGGELRRVTRMAFYLMLRHNYNLPEGPVLLPLLHHLNDFCSSNDDFQSDNAVFQSPSQSKDEGSENICLQCIAMRDLAVGETISVSTSS